MDIVISGMVLAKIVGFIIFSAFFALACFLPINDKQPGWRTFFYLFLPVDIICGLLWFKVVTITIS